MTPTLRAMAYGQPVSYTHLELLPYPGDDLLKGTVLFHIAINLSCEST